MDSMGGVIVQIAIDKIAHLAPSQISLSHGIIYLILEKLEKEEIRRII